MFWQCSILDQREGRLAYFCEALRQGDMMDILNLYQESVKFMASFHREELLEEWQGALQRCLVMEKYIYSLKNFCQWVEEGKKNS